MINNPLTIDGWKYYANVDEHQQLHLGVRSPKHDEPPTNLYKLSELSEWSLDALENSYLYGSHPRNFNDLFDCHKDLIISDCTYSRRVILDFMKEAYGSQLDELTPKELDERLHETRTDLAYVSFGLVCMTPVPDNVLMWAYYGNNKGFMVEYDYVQFPGNFYGPFPINYQSEIKQISLRNHGARVATLYQSLVKSKRWEHENEWRFLCMSDNEQALLPFGVKGTETNHGHDRKFKFPETAVKSVALGNRFFDIEQMQIKDQDLTVQFNDNTDKRKRLLDLIIARNLNVRIAMQQDDLMRIDFKHCDLVKKDEKVYHFTNKK
jgi:hypothetical protein